MLLVNVINNINLKESTQINFMLQNSSSNDTLIW